MNPATGLESVEEPRAGHPFFGSRPPPQTLDAFFSEVFDRGIFKAYLPSPGVDDVAQMNLAAAAVQDMHAQMNDEMRNHGILLSHDDYGLDQSKQPERRPPCGVLYIMSAPWLSKHNQGKVPLVAVSSKEQMLVLKSHGWLQSSCLCFNEESDIPPSIIDGSAWTSSSCSEGRSIVDDMKMLPTSTSPFPNHEAIDIIKQKSET